MDTPAPLTRALLYYLPGLRGLMVVEPCAGQGNISRVLAVEGDCAVASFDIEPRAEDIAEADTLTPGFFEQIAMTHGTDLAIVTNPPFSLAAEYWRRTQAFALTVLLVRQTWLEPTNDRADVRDPDAMIVVPRPRFTGPGAVDPATGQPYTGSDSSTVAWMVWANPSCPRARAWLPCRPIVRVTRRAMTHWHSPGVEAVS